MLRVDFNEDKVEEVAQKNNGCLVETEEAVLKLSAVDRLSPVDCQKSTGDVKDDVEKSNLARLVVDNEDGEVFGEVGSVAGLAQDGVAVDGVVAHGRTVEDLQKNKI